MTTDLFTRYQIDNCKPHKELVLKQITELYRDGYVDLKTADHLATKYTDVVRVE